MSLVDSIQERLSGDRLGDLAVSLGRGEDQARAAAGAALPAVLASLSNQVLDGRALDGLLRALRDRPEAGAEEPSAEEGDRIGHVLGSSLPALVDLLARTTGLDEKGVRRLLEVLGPIVLDAVAARSLAEGGLDAERLIHVFTAVKPKIAQAFPEGLSLADLPSTPDVSATGGDGAGMSGWVLPALVVALVAASLLVFLGQPAVESVDADSAEPPTPSKADPTPPPPPIERESTPAARRVRAGSIGVCDGRSW